MSKPIAVVLFLSSIAWTSASASAQAQDDPEFSLPDSVDLSKVRRMTLQEALQIAIRNNLGIQLQREQIVQGKAALRASEGAFEPQLRANFEHNDSISPPATSLDGMPGDTFESQIQRWSSALTKPLSTGASLSLDFFSSRNLSGSGSAVEPLVYGSNLSLGLTQPLLRGFSLDRDVPRESILRAEFANDKNLAALQVVVSREVRRTEDAYWNLAEATRSFGLQKASLELAREQQGLTQKQIEAGILAPADLISSESSVAQRELSLVQAEANMSRAMDDLRHALNLPDAQWSQVLLAIDRPRMEPRSLTLEEAMNDALLNRPEMRQNDIDQEIATLDERVADNNRLPDLDLGVRYGVVGQDSVYGGTLSQLQGLGARSWGVFLNLSWSPLGHVASANADSIRSANRSREIRHQQFLNSLRSEIRGSLRRLETAQRQVVASEKFRGLAERSLEAERKRFLNGKSRNLEVSRREDELARARTAELSARIAFLKASSDLDLATGNLLARKHIEMRLASH